MTLFFWKQKVEYYFCITQNVIEFHIYILNDTQCIFDMYYWSNIKPIIWDISNQYNCQKLLLFLIMCQTISGRIFSFTLWLSRPDIRYVQISWITFQVVLLLHSSVEFVLAWWRQLWRQRFGSTLPRVMFFTWWHQAITWTNVYFLMRFCGIQLRVISHRMPMIFCIMSLKKQFNFRWTSINIA